MYPAIRLFAKSKNRPIDSARCTRGAKKPSVSVATLRPFQKYIARRRVGMSDPHVRPRRVRTRLGHVPGTHRQTHGENHVPTRDFNCCGEDAGLMALRAASGLKPGYPERLLLRMAPMPEL